MIKTSRALVVFAVAASALTFGTTAFSMEESTTTDLNAILCKDLMRLSGEDRAIAIAVLHGYVLGKKGATTYVSEKLGKVSDDFTDYCLDNPTSKALESFSKIAK
ncbi:hypothetical protein CEW87_07100 [Parazoarcus communis]|uniref:Uncharacterized protein n=1 Tax=Parazoarcus communis TaxID=41977 RepID=A0A2U8GZT1_9RHOO|nr:HdeA/HdeB family chaperone [Parazoarcus communis]AWI79151.1 hypothetical protein CEW87_07100 [Parazoarcus communis]